MSGQKVGAGGDQKQGRNQKKWITRA